MKEIYKHINDFDIVMALKEAKSKYPQMYLQLLFKFGLFEELIYFLEASQSQNNTFNLELIKLVINAKVDSVLNDKRFEVISREILLAYVINYKIQNRFLNIDEAVKFLDDLRLNFDKYNRFTIIYIFVEIFDYFYELEDWSFFAKARSSVNFLLNEKFINHQGAIKYFKNYTEIFNKYCNNSNCRVAIVIAGAYRGHFRHCLKSVVDLATGLDADIFISTWDTSCSYPGVCGAGMNYAHRNFSAILGSCPEIIINKAGLKKHFFNTFKILDTEINEPLNDLEFKLYSSIKQYSLSNNLLFENNIIKQNYMDKISYTTKEDLELHRGRYFINVFKQFYHIANAKKLVLDYESKHSFKYDYIIRVRPDANVRMLDRSELFKLKSGDFAVALTSRGEGLTDICFYAKRDEMLKFMDLYNVDKMQEFKYFTKMFLVGGIHGLLTNWAMLNKLKVVPMRLPVSLENKYHISFLPNFDDALKEDIKNTTLNKDELYKCLNFFDKIKELIKNNNTEIKNLNYKEITAEFRIKNQLSYKLGQAMI
ncbi:hypothetical protein [Campylobacter gastrosuis]|uniref:Uncharacterized protein n=1 Tax=Campylobacter gastrosuis TaxID=2974576 RepID=A0ABT7HNZ4_9BACT|nr:hypothetical protein [Campylobacter gastrosuis]MDL0088635.1 hypothetical protein [Campylobacter gastrosuis]